MLGEILIFIENSKHFFSPVHALQRNNKWDDSKPN